MAPSINYVTQGGGVGGSMICVTQSYGGGWGARGQALHNS